MSELKAETIVPQGTTITLQMYPKSEADKVIAELEERIADGDKDFEMANNQNERLLKIVRHHKYKRCMEKAAWCKDKMQHYKYDDKVILYGFRFYERWYKRWLEIAEKFKEAK